MCSKRIRGFFSFQQSRRTFWSNPIFSCIKMKGTKGQHKNFYLILRSLRNLKVSFVKNMKNMNLLNFCLQYCELVQSCHWFNTSEILYVQNPEILSQAEFTFQSLNLAPQFESSSRIRILFSGSNLPPGFESISWVQIRFPGSNLAPGSKSDSRVRI
jgi:hypothetical protein